MKCEKHSCLKHGAFGLQMCMYFTDIPEQVIKLILKENIIMLNVCTPYHGCWWTADSIDRRIVGHGGKCSVRFYRMKSSTACASADKWDFEQALMFPRNNVKEFLDYIQAATQNGQ